MPAPTTAPSAPPTPTGDLLVAISIVREGEFPTITLGFAHCGDTDGSNCFGLPKYPRSQEAGYALHLDSRKPLARQRIGAMQVAAANRIVAGEGLDAAMANEAYALLAECVTAGTTEAIVALGVEIMGANPFP